MDNVKLEVFFLNFHKQSPLMDKPPNPLFSPFLKIAKYSQDMILLSLVLWR